MNEYRFAAYPSNSSIAAGVTLLVSTWFLVAAGAILSDPTSPYTQRERTGEVIVSDVKPVALIEPAPAVTTVAQDTRITVHARRSTT